MTNVDIADSVGAKLAQAVARLEVIATRLEATKAARAEAEVNAKALKEQIEHLTNDLHTAGQKITGLEEEIEHLRLENTNLTEQQAQAVHKIDNAMARLEALLAA